MSYRSAMSETPSSKLGAKFGAPTAGARIATGRLDPAGDVVRAPPVGPEARLAALRSALAVGEASGPATPFDFEAFIGGKRAIETRVD